MLLKGKRNAGSKIQLNKLTIYVIIYIHMQASVNILEDRRSTHFDIIVIDLLNMMFKRSMDEEYVDNRNMITRRHDGVILKIPIPNKESFKKSVIFRGGSLRNSLLLVITSGSTQSAHTQ